MRRPLLISLLFVVLLAGGALTATLLAGNSPELGLDLQGGVSVVLQPKEEVPSDRLDQSIEIIRNRVDALGVAEPEIARQGNAIVVQLPGVRDQQRALELVGQTAELRFRPVLATLGPVGATTTTTAPPETTTTTAADGSTTTTEADGSTTTTAADGSTTTTEPADGDAFSDLSRPPAAGLAEGEQAQAQPSTSSSATTATTAAETTTTTAAEGAATSTTATTAPATTPTTNAEGVTPREADDPEAEVIFPGREGDPTRYVLGPSQLTGEALNTADARFDETSGEWGVFPEFSGDGIASFNAVAGQCFNREQTCPTQQLAIVLDGVVQSAPTIQEPSFQPDQIRISGAFSEGEAKDLALVLRYGALPVELERQSVQTVSATLGKDSLHAGVIAGLVGVGLVVLFMLAYYRMLAAVVLLGLCVSAALLWSIVAYLGESQGLALTLAGATGIIVSIGVTVDSYVVYFERLKDDLESGKTLRSSVDRGFTNAYRTIINADLVSLIGALLLYWLTVGPVRGFAFFLALSTALDMFVAYFFTRPAVALMARSPRFGARATLGVGTRRPAEALA
ncbi:MAG TPA: protein translocase subunit SecD [Acidimicrobiales bacterium]|jgi:preprotein translocase subunit SecD